MLIDWGKVVTVETKARAATDDLIAEIRRQVDAQVEATARDKGYNSAAHCASYAPSTVPQWAAEARAFIAWRDTVWLTVYGYMELVLAAQEPMPAGVADVLARLPSIDWPDAT